VSGCSCAPAIPACTANLFRSLASGLYNPDQIVPVIPEQSVPVIPDQSVPVIPDQSVPVIPEQIVPL